MWIKNSKDSMKEHSEYMRKTAKYKNLFDTYYNIISNFQNDWKLINTSRNYTSVYAREYEKKCLRAISLTEDIRKASLDRDGDEPREYPAFKRLAILYEKQGRIYEAIAICELAILHNCAFDGTKGGMNARVERLKVKSQ